MSTDRFDGWIAGLGTGSGLRTVIGIWPRSPLGSFADVMVERADGHRLLLAPSPQVADFVAATYTFDEVRIEPVGTSTDGTRWQITAGPLETEFTVGRRAALGWLLRSVPPPLRTSPAWISAIDVVARSVLPGVRTRGSAVGGREEFYGAQDLHAIATAAVLWEGLDQGALSPVDPPVRFGFGSTPHAPSFTRVTTLVRRPGAP